MIMKKHRKREYVATAILRLALIFVVIIFLAIIFNKINVVGFSYFAAVFCLFTAWAIQPLHIFTVDEITKKAGELSKERFKFLDFKEFDSGFLLSLSFFAEREHIIKIFLDQPLAEINLPLKIVWD